MKQYIYGIGGYNLDIPNGNLLEVVELPDPPQKPLDETGVLATLLAVTGVLSVEDAANAVNRTADELVLEAQAWAVAGNSL